MHPLRKLRESGDNTPAAVAKLLAENVVFHSPLLVRALEGRERVAVIMAASPKLPDGAYTAEFRLDEGSTFLRSKGNIEGREIEGFGVVANNDQGLREESFRACASVHETRHLNKPDGTAGGSLFKGERRVELED
jgi:hypothetical protein